MSLDLFVTCVRGAFVIVVLLGAIVGLVLAVVR